MKLQRGFCYLCHSLLNHCIHNLHFEVETISKRPTFSTWLYSLYQIPLHLSLLKCCWRRRQLANPWWNVVLIRSSPPFTRPCVPWRWTDGSYPLFRLTSNIWIGRISVDFWCTGPEQPKENISYSGMLSLECLIFGKSRFFKLKVAPLDLLLHIVLLCSNKKHYNNYCKPDVTCWNLHSSKLLIFQTNFAILHFPYRLVLIRHNKKVRWGDTCSSRKAWWPNNQRGQQTEMKS